MKKGFLSVLVLSVFTFFSCNSSYRAGEAETDANAAAVVNAEEVAYKVVNNHIVPQNGLPTIVDFSATWCPPCQKLKPIFSKLEEEFKGRINFITIDVDENPQISQSYGVQSIPMLIFMDKDGQVKNIVVGFQTREQLLETINTYFGF